MIKPTVGRVVWYHAKQDRAPGHPDDQPLAAIVAYVHDDRTINVMAISALGVPFPATDVALLQDNDQPTEDGRFASWMPYQKGQAAKAEALEARPAEPPQKPTIDELEKLLKEDGAPATINPDGTVTPTAS